MSKDNENRTQLPLFDEEPDQFEVSKRTFGRRWKVAPLTTPVDPIDERDIQLVDLNEQNVVGGTSTRKP